MQTTKMKQKIHYQQVLKETKRQLLHAGAGTLGILILLLFGIENMILILIVALIIGLILMTLIRFVEIPFLIKIVDLVERNHEKIWKGQGAMVLGAGMLLTILVAYILEVGTIGALAGLVVLAYGDSASTIIGKSFGKIKLTKKVSLEGSFAGILIAAVVLHIWFNPTTAFAIATFGMIAELLPIEDNITIPLFALTMATTLI